MKGVMSARKEKPQTSAKSSSSSLPLFLSFVCGTGWVISLFIRFAIIFLTWATNKQVSITYLYLLQKNINKLPKFTALFNIYNLFRKTVCEDKNILEIMLYFFGNSWLSCQPIYDITQFKISFSVWDLNDTKWPVSDENSWQIFLFFKASSHFFRPFNTV